MRAKKQSTPSRKAPVPTKAPTDTELKAFLGKAGAVWLAIVRAVEEKVAPLDKEWKPSKLAFGRVCLLRHKKRTLLYLIPDKGQVVVAVVLGERAYELAMAASLSAAIKKMLSEAKPYAEGRGIRFVVKTEADVAEVVTLARCVMEGT